MAITEDTGNEPAALQWTTTWGTSQTTAAFSPQSGTLLLAIVSGDGNTAVAAVATVSDSLSGVWSLLKRTNNASGTVAGTVEVWCRYLAAAPGSMTVSVSATASTAGGTLIVKCLLGASSTQAGATAGLVCNPAAVQQSITPGAAGNMVYGGAFNWDAASALTPLANTTNVSPFLDAPDVAWWSGLKSAAITTTSPTTYGYSTSTHGIITLVEIQAGAGGAATVPAQPPAAPGKTWRRRFKHRQQVFITPLGDASLTLADTGAGSDAVTLTAAVPLTDTGTGADTLGAVAAVPLADTGTAADAITVTVAAPLADAGTGADALAATAAVPLADTGAGADAVTLTAAVPLADTGTGADAISVVSGSQITLTDTGTVADALTVTTAVPLADTGTGADTVALTAAVPLTDTGSAADAITVQQGNNPALPDTATAADTITATVVLALTDPRTAVDAVTTAAAIPLADTAHATDALTVTVTLALADTATAADTARANAALVLAEAAAIVDAIAVALPGTAFDDVTAVPTVPPRWAVALAVGGWDVDAAPGWDVNPAPGWDVHPAPPDWT